MSTDAAHRSFLSYIDRSREYYAAQGYERAYRWARPAGPPALCPLPGPLPGLRLGLVTTAFPSPPAGLAPAVELPYAHAAFPPPATPFTAFDNRDTSVAPANERESFLPLERLGELVAAGQLGSVSPRFYGVPFDYSHRRTSEQDAPTVAQLLRADAVEAAMLVPHCPLCHQTVALVARYLEADGLPTVVVGSARDIVEEIGVPRLLFTDFPLGYPIGRPGDADQQRDVCAQALTLLASAAAPRTTVHALASWGDDDWRDRYMRVDPATSPSLAAAGTSRREDQARARAEGRTRTT